MSDKEVFWEDVKDKHKSHFVTNGMQGKYCIAKMCYTCNKAFKLRKPEYEKYGDVE